MKMSTLFLLTIVFYWNCILCAPLPPDVVTHHDKNNIIDSNEKSELLQVLSPRTLDSTVLPDESDDKCPQMPTVKNGIAPGPVQEVKINFLTKTENGTQQHVFALFTWKRPKLKIVDYILNGYYVFWATSLSDHHCSILSKNESQFVIKSGKDWSYPNTIYLTILPLPQKSKFSVVLSQYIPQASKTTIAPANVAK